MPPSLVAEFPPPRKHAVIAVEAKKERRVRGFTDILFRNKQTIEAMRDRAQKWVFGECDGLIDSINLIAMISGA